MLILMLIHIQNMFFWSVFFCIQTEYGDFQSKSPYLVQMRQHTDQKKSEYGYFLRSVNL